MGVNARTGPAAVVMGRVGADLYPLQLNTRLEEVRTFERFVGGFAGNVATALARLDVRSAIVSAVGDDGHGRYVRTFLEAEGVDTTWMTTHPVLRTALAFCEAWPPDRFPITFYREPTCPDWELTLETLPLAGIAAAPVAYFSGTGLARQPSRGATLGALAHRLAATRQEAGSAPGHDDAAANRDNPSAIRATILDLDWRPDLWHEPSAFAELVRQAVPMVDTVIGGASEFEAAGLQPTQTLLLGPSVAIVKHGPRGATVVRGERSTHVDGLPVPVTNGLGAGDAFAAAYGAAILEGRDPEQAARRGNAAGAIVATRLSCSAAMPRVAELEMLLSGGTVADGVVRPPAGRIAR
jgi:5-dehydro-2-deoxygluconokinase